MFRSSLHPMRGAPVPRRVQDRVRGYDKRRKAPLRYDRKRPSFTPAEEQRFMERTMVERRVYSRLKDEIEPASFVSAARARSWPV